MIPDNNNNKIYNEGITIIIDSLSHSNPLRMRTTKDEKTEGMYANGGYEDEDTPIEVINEPKILIHNKNEIPLFLGPDTRVATVKRKRIINGVGEVFIPLQVNYDPSSWNTFIIKKLFNIICVMSD